MVTVAVAVAVEVVVAVAVAVVMAVAVAVPVAAAVAVVVAVVIPTPLRLQQAATHCGAGGEVEGERMQGVKKHRVVPRPEGVIGIRGFVGSYLRCGVVWCGVVWCGVDVRGGSEEIEHLLWDLAVALS